MLIIMHVRRTHACANDSLDRSLSRVNKGPRANICHGSRLALIRHWVDLSVPSTRRSSGGFAAERPAGMQHVSIDCCTARPSSTNAGSVTLTADVGS